MEPRVHCWGLLCLLINLYIASTFLSRPCEARSSRQSKNSFPLDSRAGKHRTSQHTRALKRLGTYSSSPDATNYNYYYNYMGSPLSLPPFQDVMGPSSSPGDYCLYPPLTPLPPSTTLPTPIFPIQSSPPPPPIPPSPLLLTPNPPPESSTTSPPVYNFPSPPGPVTNPPEYVPSPPSNVPSYVPSPPSNVPSYLPSPPPLFYIPSPPEEYVPRPPITMPGNVPNPPDQYVPSPPLSYIPSPPEYVPGPPEILPSPPVFQPPVVYPPPAVPPPPPYALGTMPLWCVAKPTVPDPIIQEAMNYACGSGADCDSIQPNGSCYHPDTLIAHASFAFNSYWQRTKVAGGTCDFGGTAMLITKDPSYDGCRFIMY